MALTVQEIREGTGLDWTVNKETNRRQAVRKFQVHSDTGTDTMKNVESVIPQEYDYYPGYSWLRVSDREILLDERSGSVWNVTVSYSETADSGPILAPPVVRWDSVSSTEEVEHDRDNKPILNVNNERMALTRQYNDMLLTITRNQYVFSASVAEEFVGTINQTIFYGSAPDTALCKSISGLLQTAEGYPYWRVTYVFQFRRQKDHEGTLIGWKKRIANRGFVERVVDSGGVPIEPAKYQVITDEHGVELNEPSLLKANGTVEPDKNNTHWLYFDVYEKTLFGTLNLE